jgi:hypothetical protein
VQQATEEVEVVVEVLLRVEGTVDVQTVAAVAHGVERASDAGLVECEDEMVRGTFAVNL